MGIDFAELTNIKEIDDKDTTNFSLYDLAERAKTYISSFKWAVGIKEGFLANGFDGILGVFLFKIVPESEKVDELLWVICGDIPPAYLVTDCAKTGLEALALYVEEMQKWVDAVFSGAFVNDLIPVNVAPDEEYAEMLLTRLNFIREEILFNQLSGDE